MLQTIAVPVTPSLQLSDPRFLLALLLLAFKSAASGLNNQAAAFYDQSQRNRWSTPLRRSKLAFLHFLCCIARHRERERR